MKTRVELLKAIEKAVAAHASATMRFAFNPHGKNEAYALLKTSGKVTKLLDQCVSAR